MLNQNVNLLKIDYEIQKGLLLKWNLNGHVSMDFFRHIIIIDCDQDPESEYFLAKFYNRVKSGDFVTILYVDDIGIPTIKKWREKTSLDSIKYKKKYSKSLTLKQLAHLLDFLDEKIGDFTEVTTIDIFTQKSHDQFEKWMEKSHNHLKSLIKKNSVFFLYGKELPSNMNFGSSINSFNTDDFQLNEILSFIKLYLSQIVLKHLKITIECENGNISCQKDNNWISVDFHKIERTLYAVPLNYSKDTVYFLNEGTVKNVHYKLRIRLEYEFMSGKKCLAEKRISVQAVNDKAYTRTIGFKDNQIFSLDKNIQCKENPYESSNYAWFSEMEKKENETELEPFGR